MNAPPLIGVTAGNDPQRPETYIVRWDYLRSVELAGGIPVVLAPSGPALHPGCLDRLDGLILSGGVDISSDLYDKALQSSAKRAHLERDEFELLLLRAAFQRDLPVLGICRGCQMLNVARGGTLIQDLPSLVGTSVSHDDPDRPRVEVAHSVKLVSGTRLASLLGSAELEVNSFHHQAVERLGDGLVETAFAPDGVIEGVELPGAGFVLGVQWHPEAFWRKPVRFGALFRGLIEAASCRQGALPTLATR